MTILVDTSAWIEFLRRTGSEANVRLRELRPIRRQRVATTDVVIMELLQGSLTPRARDRIWGTMNWCVMLPTRPLFDYEVAADLYRRCRRAGFTPANSHDLLIAAVAIGKGVPLLAADGDFERIADGVRAATGRCLSPTFSKRAPGPYHDAPFPGTHGQRRRRIHTDAWHRREDAP